jgi:hypothetical protein
MNSLNYVYFSGVKDAKKQRDRVCGIGYALEITTSAEASRSRVPFAVVE